MSLGSISGAQLSGVTASGLRLGVTLRNMGDQSTPALMGECARLAEASPLASLWVVDHLAIPPDDAEGSNGRYLDPLGSLAWLAGRTKRIHLGVGVLILPYRPPLPTAKLIATVQELSGERLILGAGGRLDAERVQCPGPRSTTPRSWILI